MALSARRCSLLRRPLRRESVVVDSSGRIQVSVPMFYRVRGTPPPPLGRATFTKWVTAFPNQPGLIASMAGVVGGDVGTGSYAGEVLKMSTDAATGVTEIVASENLRFYNYEAKYAEGGSIHIVPAPILPDVYQLVEKFTLQAHQALGCRGVSRADFRFDDTPGGSGDLLCLEVNTQPGMTATSLVPELAAHAGLSFPELVRWMVEDASCNR